VGWRPDLPAQRDYYSGRDKRTERDGVVSGENDQTLLGALCFDEKREKIIRLKIKIYRFIKI
jgi:hypothetical protein